MIQSIKHIFEKAAGLGLLTAAPATAFASTGVAAATLALGPVTFAAPWVLLGLGSLPALWFLMRSVPPQPVIHAFPAMSILFNLTSEDQSPARMPLWQRLLRLTAAGLVVTGLAQPQLNNDIPLDGDGPVMLVIDNGWASARNWTARKEELKKIIDRAEKNDRKVIVLQTAAPEDGSAIRPTAPLSPTEARKLLLEAKPQPWPVNRQGALDAIQNVDLTNAASVIWLSNGLDDPGALALAERLQNFGKLTVMQDNPVIGAHLLALPQAGDDFTVTLRRAAGTQDEQVQLVASDESGRTIHKAMVDFKAGETETKAVFPLSKDMQRQVTRVHIDGEHSAGAVVLLDERWRRRPVGLIEAARVDNGQVLLHDSNYVSRALEPYVDLQRESAETLLQKKMAVMILTDSVILQGGAQRRLHDWVAEGGTLLRFAGPNLASNKKADDLVSVPVRPGVQAIGGGRKISPFGDSSPFHGIKIPDDVVIDRGVLAQPGPDLDERVWAQLEDGTPLVTASRNGKGWIVLVHTTANTEWSNLALSGAFVDMMRAVVNHSNGISNDDQPDFSLPALKTLDGFGQFVPPPATVKSLDRGTVTAGSVGPDHPPGFYGNETMRQAHNLASAVPTLKALPELGDSVRHREIAAGKDGNELSGPLLAGAMSLLILDLLILLSQQGLLPRMRRNNAPAPKN